MSDFPESVRINEEGPREGFQIEKGAIPARRKIELIDMLSQTAGEIVGHPLPGSVKMGGSLQKLRAGLHGLA